MLKLNLSKIYCAIKQVSWY